MKKLKALEILDYYDYPLLFIAEDEQEKPFLCMLVDESDSLEYLIVRTSFDTIERLKHNEKDIRSIFEQPKDNAYYVAKLNSETDRWFEATDIPRQEICRYFPEMGAFSNEELVDYTMKSSSAFKTDMTDSCGSESGNIYNLIKILASDIVIPIIETYENVTGNLYKPVPPSANTVEIEKGDLLCLIAA